MKRSLTFTLFLALVSPLVLGTDAARAAGPYQYFGVNLPHDAQSFTYPNVGPTQTQYMQFVLDTGDVIRPGVHLGFGLRGKFMPVGEAPRGRGIIIGYFSNSPNAGDCQPGPHVAIEDFTVNHLDGAGILAGSCQPFDFQDNTAYLVEVWATFDDVRYTISERFWDWELRRWTWEPALFGGCKLTTGRYCEQHMADENFGSFFVGSTADDGNTSQNWSAQQILVTHY